jgi:hypothetical protein
MTKKPKSAPPKKKRLAPGRTTSREGTSKAIGTPIPMDQVNPAGCQAFFFPGSCAVGKGVSETIWAGGAGGGVGAVVAVVDVPSCVDASHWADAKVAGKQSATSKAADLKPIFLILTSRSRQLYSG